MRERNYSMFVGIIFLALIAGWICLPDNPGLRVGPINKDVKVHEGLDLQGGLQVTLQANVADCGSVTADSMAAAKAIVENRINGLGVTEPRIELSGQCRIIVQLPGINDPDTAIKTFGGTGLLEFIDAGDTPLSQDQVVQTTGPSSVVLPGQSLPTSTVTPTVATTPVLTSTAEITTTAPVTATTPVTPTFRTVMTGAQLKSAAKAFDNLNQPYIRFELTDDGGKIFGDYTSKNVNKYLAITMDKVVISSPVIKSAITGGSGVIEGKFTNPEADRLVVQLKYGALPVPLKVVQSSTVGPTLGRDSVNRSLTAGAIGLFIVVLFMLLYYRLPGLLADVALTVYALVVFAIYKFGIPGLLDYVTLTLPGIAGFILSVGMAVDANILIFERMKEELRAGRTLQMAIEAGFHRAWPSIRDWNASTLITCAILFWYGLTQGASIVSGFATTLAIGVMLSLFTAVTVTRTFLRLTLDFGVTENLWWFGISTPSK